MSEFCRINYQAADLVILSAFQKTARIEMLDIKGMRFPLDVILLCISWYAAYPLSYRHLEEMLEERSVCVDHSSINRWAIRCLCWKPFSANASVPLHKLAYG